MLGGRSFVNRTMDMLCRLIDHSLLQMEANFTSRETPLNSQERVDD